MRRDRPGPQRNDLNFRYENMSRRRKSLHIPATAPHFDDGITELDPDPIFDWHTICGYSPELAWT
jgi:hypothetical protein